MKPSHHTTPAGTETTFTQIWTWAQELDRLLTRIAPRFVRQEPRRRALAYLRGILSDSFGTTGKAREFSSGRLSRLCHGPWAYSAGSGTLSALGLDARSAAVPRSRYS